MGLLYLDDGNSFRYKTHLENALIKYTYSGGELYCESQFDREHLFEPAYTLKIVEVNIYGMLSMPDKVISESKLRRNLDFDYNKNR